MMNTYNNISDDAVIITYKDGHKIAQTAGNFDQWCIYVGYPQRDGSIKWVRAVDARYFKTMKNLAQQVGADNLYNTFVAVYDLAGDSIHNKDLTTIRQLAATYPSPYAKTVSMLYYILYLGMIAENNKEGTRLGKRIKRLGVYELLIEDQAPDVAANASRKKDWHTLDKMCRDRGF